MLKRIVSQQRPQHMSGSPDYPGKAKPRKKISYTWALPEEDESPLYRYGCCWPCRVSSGTSLEGKISTNGSNQEDKDHALALPPPYQTGSVSTLHELSVQRCPLIRPGQPPHPH
ncbi:hypothetical protein O6H91_13G045200 [Diphasiastrum complanatum]|uniref:Uncharacterized protein n=1 Tax=Diphasiastrum complanatum TaxID=34168 RepID=A0ACC2BUC6_DIPCM|nr:hypothetical protein O6H91_13G045200 [Diphasiastrum complanatum]